jgi:tRNA A-37 threonylcarbamoyl transferase component Bud32
VTEIGSTLGGRYRLVELLGQGGMATIYRARDAQLERDVAVKLLRPEFGRDPDFLARFRDEARSAASLSHPNVVSVFDFGEDASGPFIVMELVDGEDLASILRGNGPLAPRQAARISAEVAKALQAAHARGIVHRDVKPSNILVSRDGRVKVADFGIARAVTESQLTLPGTTMGSVHYFSPEQARGEVATAASDVYALGIVLFESLTGQRPFSGDGAAAVAMARLTSPPPVPSAVRSTVPPELDQIVQRAMALEPADRYPSAAAMASALEGFLADAGRPAGTGAMAAGAAAGAAAGVAAAGAASAAGQAPAARTVASAQARPNQPLPYPPDAYAGGSSAPVSTRGGPPPPPQQGDEDGEDEGSSPWAWVAGLLGLAILVVVGFLLFQLLTSGGSAGPTPSPSASAGSVTVPNFVGMDYETAKTQAEALGLTLVIASSEQSDRPENEILSQDPVANVSVAQGTEISVVTARGPVAVPVPDLRGKTENEALQLIVSGGLTVGTRSEAFDPLVAAGLVVSQNPGPGIIVTPLAPVDYTISKGPEPTPTPTPPPTPTPTPPPTPTPTPPPTPTPTEAPTPTPTEAPTPTPTA